MLYKKQKTNNILSQDDKLKQKITLHNMDISLNKCLDKISKDFSVKLFADKAYVQERISVSLNQSSIIDIMDCLCGMFNTIWQKKAGSYILMPYIPGLQNHIPPIENRRKAMELLNDFRDCKIKCAFS